MARSRYPAYASNPSPSAWEVARDILGYLSQTSNYSIWIKKGASSASFNKSSRSHNTVMPPLPQDRKDALSLALSPFLVAPLFSGLVDNRPLLLLLPPILEFIAAYDAALAVLPLYPLLSEILPD